MGIKSVFVVWFRHSRRAKTLAAELGGQISFQYESGLKGPWLAPLRYLVQGWKTWRLLEREQPQAVIVQIPPIFALMLVAAWCKLRGKTRSSEHRVPYVIDCHTGAIHNKWRWSIPLLRLLSRRAAVTLVASQEVHCLLQRWKVKSCFLIDGIPILNQATGTMGSDGDSRVAVICSFGLDEPIAEILAAARLLPHITFYLTGDPKPQVTHLLVQKPENVILTGYLKDSDYIGLLKNVHGMVDLTNEPSILTCGAYEALAMVKPSVVSNWPQIKQYFGRGFIYVNNTPEEIASGVEKMLNDREMLTSEMITMRSELVSTRQPKFEEFRALFMAESIGQES